MKRKQKNALDLGRPPGQQTLNSNGWPARDGGVETQDVVFAVRLGNRAAHSRMKPDPKGSLSGSSQALARPVGVVRCQLLLFPWTSPPTGMGSSHHRGKNPADHFPGSQGQGVSRRRVWPMNLWKSQVNEARWGLPGESSVRAPGRSYIPVSSRRSR